MARLRVVSYAINGRGLGHLTRQLAILRQVQRICAVLDITAECWVLTSSEGDTLARREGIPALKMPSKAMFRDAGLEPSRYLSIARGWVLNAVAGLQPDVLLVDTFPAGSFGELVPVLELAKRRVLVARRVREEFAQDPSYSALLPLFDSTITPDARGTGPIMLRSRHELLPRDEARAALGVAEDARAIYVSLGGGGDLAVPTQLPRLVDSLLGRGHHVVVGAGPLYSGPERRGPGITWLSRYAPTELFAGLDGAVSAAGYNTFHELMHAGVPTVFVPQPRIADDQEERALRAEAAGAARVASTFEEVPDLLDALLASGNARSAAISLAPANGAVAAAVEALTGAVTAEDLAMAQSVLTPEVSQLLEPLVRSGRGPEGARKAMKLVRLLSGGSPSQQRRRRALMLELADEGHDVSDPGPPRDHTAQQLSRFVGLCTAHGVPLDTALLLAEGLLKKFPAARGSDLLDAADALFPAWARFDDWMGAVSLLRAVPTQRRLALPEFGARVAAWLGQHDDLFDAVRAFSRLEGAGSRPVAEVLTMLEERA
ncbi:MAG: hypothetical protein KDA24_17840 [Deltaproteobacteria bacterium]|nr:hypothetical protein [Deltaproteobacteria bacterium]